MSLNRREMLRLGALGAAGAILSTAAGSAVLPGLLTPINPGLNPLNPLAPPPAPLQPPAISAVDPQLLARAKAALDARRIVARDSIGIVDFSRPSGDARFHVVDLMSGNVESHRVAHGRGSDPDHSGFLEKFSNDFGSHASSSGTYVTADYYEGKYGLSMKVRGLDLTNYNAEPRAIVIHNAWYAEDEVARDFGKLGRSEGCFAFSRASQWNVMSRLANGRMIYAEKLA